MRQEQSERLAASIVEFGRFLRMSGLAAEPSQTITALEAVKAINATDRQTFAFALQAALCSTNEEWELFPKLFQEFWGESQPRPRSASGEYKGHSKGKAPEREDGSTVFLDQPANAAAGQAGKGALPASFASDELAPLAETHHQHTRRSRRSPQKHPAEHHAWR